VLVTAETRSICLPIISSFSSGYDPVLDSLDGVALLKGRIGQHFLPDVLPKDVWRDVDALAWRLLRRRVLHDPGDVEVALLRYPLYVCHAVDPRGRVAVRSLVSQPAHVEFSGYIDPGGLCLSNHPPG